MRPRLTTSASCLLPPASSRRGFTLIDLTVALFLLGALTLITVAVTTSSLQAMRISGKRQHALSNFDSAVTAIRRDLYACPAPAAEDEWTLLLPQAGGSLVRYQIDREGHLHRRVFTADLVPDANQPERQWPEVASGMTFHVAGPLLTLHTRDTRGEDRPSTITLPSAALIAGGAQ